jgi:hypothetical protein
MKRMTAILRGGMAALATVCVTACSAAPSSQSSEGDVGASASALTSGPCLFKIDVGGSCPKQHTTPPPAPAPTSKPKTDGGPGDTTPTPETNGTGDGTTAYDDCLNECLAEIVPENADPGGPDETKLAPILGGTSDAESCRLRCSGYRGGVPPVPLPSFH